MGARDARRRGGIGPRRRIVRRVDGRVGVAAVEGVDHLAVGVAAHPPHGQLEPRQAIEDLGRHRPGRDVAADHDRVHLAEGGIGEHGVERGQVPVHVVEGGDDAHTDGPDAAGGACC